MTLSGSAGALSFGYKMPEADHEGLAEGFVESCGGFVQFSKDLCGVYRVAQRSGVPGLQKGHMGVFENMGHLISQSL